MGNKTDRPSIAIWCISGSSLHITFLLTGIRNGHVSETALEGPSPRLHPLQSHADARLQQNCHAVDPGSLLLKREESEISRDYSSQSLGQAMAQWRTFV